MASAISLRTLVLGGIRSGKSEFAEALVADSARVHYVATARLTGAHGETDPAFSARVEWHRARRPVSWITTELGDEPRALPMLLEDAAPAVTLLVDDLGLWVTGMMEEVGLADLEGQAVRLGAAVRVCRARLVLVSPEVGLSMVATTEAGRLFADALGATNQTIAAACDAIALVIAGNAMWLKGGP